MNKISQERPKLLEYPGIAGEIGIMHREDQTMRKNWRLDPKTHPWDEEIDRRNTVRMKEIVNEMGVLTVSKVGQKGSFQAWILVQHADHDIDFQEQYLGLMEKESEAEIDRRNIAYLQDRVAVNRNQPQLFGTQFFRDTDGNMKPRPIADPENLEKRRKEMGLEPFEAWGSRR